MRLKKGVADRLWEDLVLAIVGDQFADVAEGRESSLSSKESADPNNEWPEICGCTISVRQHEDTDSNLRERRREDVS